MFRHSRRGAATVVALLWMMAGLLPAGAGATPPSLELLPPVSHTGEIHHERSAGLEALPLSASGGESAWQATFYGPGLDGFVYATAIWDDGSGPALYVAGDFLTAGEHRVNGIARWDGESWSPLTGPGGTGLSGWSGASPTRVLALTVYDGALIVGGNFTEAGGVEAQHIARWDGNEWSAFEGQTGNGLSNDVQALTVFEGELVVGGLFTQAGGDVRASWLTRWDGNVWLPLVGTTPGGLDAHVSGTIQALTVHEGALVAAGGFLAIAHWDGTDWIDQVFAGGIARWDGDDWTTLTGSTGTGTDSFVHAVTVLDGDLYVGGVFTEAGGVAVGRIARWDGDEWSALGSGVDGGLASIPHVNALAELDGTLLAGGHFTEAGGVDATFVARWDGTAWSALPGAGGDGLGGGPAWAAVETLTVFDGSVVAGGQFGEADGRVVNHLAQWDGDEWAPLEATIGGVLSGNIRAAVVYDGALVVAGTFQQVGDIAANGIAQWDGSEWSALEGPSGNGVSGQVAAMAVFDGELIVGGNIIEAGGMEVNRIARWDGSEWSPLGSGVGEAFNPRVASLLVFDGALIIGGDFTEAGGVSANNIARWDGSAWSALGGGVSGGTRVVLALAEYDGDLYAGGSFTQAGGTTVNRIARWDGSEWFPLTGSSGTGVTLGVSSLASFAGDLIVAGGFNSAGGVPSTRNIAGWDGNEWFALGPGIESFGVSALEVFDGALIVGGAFTEIGGEPYNRIARWDGGEWSHLTGPAGEGVTGVELGSSVSALRAMDGGGPLAGTLVVGGVFRLTGGVANWNLGVYGAGEDPSPELQFDPTSLDFGDIVVGTTSPPQPATLHNAGDGDATELSFNDTSGSGFDIDAGDCGASLPAGTSCEVIVTFTPPIEGPINTTLTAFTTGFPPALLQLSGTGVTEDSSIKITASDGLPGDLLGRAVDIDGDTAVAGAEFRDVGGNTNQGVAYVFVRDGEEWIEQAMLVASDGAQFDQFGFSVAVSGDTALIGTASDVVYVFTRDGETWSEQAQLTADDTVPDDDFGLAVALDGDTALIGARAADVDGNTNQGAVYAFVGSGDTWNQQTKFVAGDGLPFDLFGISVALDGDTAAIGASFADPDGNDAQGTAYVFTRDGETWNEEAKLLASDGVADDRFGTAVAVEGETALIGATQAQIDGNAFQGAAYVFTRDSSATQGVTWTEQAKLTADDGASGDTFGTSTALTGDTALVGALFADDAQGAAYVFERDGGTWPQQHKLTADDGLPGDQFGSALAADGDTAVIAAPIADVGGNENQGAVYVFTLGAGGPAVIPVDDGVVEVAEDGQCSLIEAFENAVDGGATHADCEPGSPAGSTIVLAPGSLYTLTAMHSDSEGPNGLPTVTGQVAVEGNDATIERSGAAPPFRPLHVGAGGELSLADLTVRGGSLGAPNLSGSGIRNDGTLSVSDSTLRENSGAGSGGAIYNATGATLTVSHSTLRNNGGGGAGSGIHNAGGGTATVTHSTLNGNNCGGGGCGIHNEGELTVENSTLSSNGGPFGGGINNLGTMTLSHVTLAANGGAQGGLLNGGTATLRNTLVANVPSAENDCAGAPPTFEGVNMIGDGTCECTGPTCLTGDPMLEPLGDNGGPTQTHALPDGSIAIDKGGDDVCLGDDQRGVARPLDGEGDGSPEDLDGGCDIGAYEAGPAPAPALVFDPASLAFGDVEVGTTSEPQNATLSNTGDGDATGLLFGTPGDGFAADTADCGPTLAAGASCTVVVTFTPAAPGAVDATLDVDSAEGASAALGLSGNGVESAEPIADITPGSFAFDLEAGGEETQTLNVGNIGDADLEWAIDEAEGLAVTAPVARASGGTSTRRDASATSAETARHLDAQGHRPSGVAVAPPATANRLPARAFGDAAWSLLGPPGGDVFDVAVSTVDSDIVLAGVAPNGISGGTLYRSADSGATWSGVPSLAGVSVLDIEFAPDGTVYAGTQDGVWTSTDDGQTWTAFDLGIGVNDTVRDVALDPSDASVLWAGVSDHNGNQAANLMRSADGGATWTDRTPPLASPMNGQRVAVAPGDSNTVIAVFGGAFGGGSVWVTTNGGDSWTDRSAGLPNNPMRDVAYDGTRLLIAGGQLFGTQDVGLYQSDDLGASWTPLHDGSWPRLVVYDVAVDPNDAQTLLVATDGTGVHRSTDGGASWEIGIGGSAPLAGRSLRFQPGSSDVLFLGTSSLAVFRSTDGGDAFASSAEGIAELDLWSVAANPAAPDELAVAFQGQNDGGVFHSADGGDTWTLEAVPPTRYDTVGFAPDGTLYALSTGPSSVAPEGLYRRESDGTWTELGPDQGDLFEADLTAMRFSLNDPDLILLGGRDSGLQQGNEGTVWRSTDRGANWSKVYDSGDSQPVIDIEIVEDGLDEVMIASYNDLTGGQVGGVLRSVDGGQSWTPAGGGLPTDFLRDSRLCAASGEPQVFYLSAWRSFGSGGLFRTDDAGATWESTGWTGGGLVHDVACHPTDGQVLYVTVQSAGTQVARSDDGGATFEAAADGLEGVAVPRALSFAGDDRLLLASDGGSYVADAPRGAGNCANPTDIPWLSVSPSSGTTAPDASAPVSVTADAAGLDAGSYAAQLCVTTNDPDAPLVVVPVALTVSGEGAPALAFTPPSLAFGDVDVDTTSAPQTATLSNTGDADATGVSLTLDPTDVGFEVDTSGCGPTLPVGASCDVSVTFSPAEPGEAAAVLRADSDQGATAEAGLSGNGVGDEGFTPVDLAVDPAGLTPEANGLFEPGETVDVAPAWRNDGELAASLGGTASSFTGPEGAAYSIDLDAADYGLIEPGDTASCLDTEVCYRLGLDDPAARPAEHWDATFDETLDDTDGTTRTWSLHIGASFADVPTTNLFYPAIETLLHSGVTGGCTAGGAAYCPGGANSRAQMPVFVLRALMGSDYTPPPCVEGNDPFGDVPFDSTFCRWIQDLANRGIVSGCGDGDYCPGNAVTRAQMSIFLLKTLEGADYEPPECSNQFTDVPCPSLFADWIEDLAAREITSGCTETEYCPGNPVSRAQMAVFVTRTFGLTLYGP